MGQERMRGEKKRRGWKGQEAKIKWEAKEKVETKKVEGEKGWEAEEAQETHGKLCPKRGLKFNGFLRQDGDKAAQCAIVLLHTGPAQLPLLGPAGLSFGLGLC